MMLFVWVGILCKDQVKVTSCIPHIFRSHGYIERPKGLIVPSKKGTHFQRTAWKGKGIEARRN